MISVKYNLPDDFEYERNTIPIGNCKKWYQGDEYEKDYNTYEKRSINEFEIFE